MMPRGLLLAAPSSSLHLFPFSSPLRRIIVWYCLSLVYKYPRVWPCQGQATAAHLSHLFSRFIRKNLSSEVRLSEDNLAPLVT